MVETNGSPGHFGAAAQRAPDRGLQAASPPAWSGSICGANYEHLTPLDEVKFVVGSMEDFKFALKVIARYNLAEKCPLLFSPVWSAVRFEELAKWMVEANAPGRMQIQLHKIIWGRRSPRSVKLCREKVWTNSRSSWR